MSGFWTLLAVAASLAALGRLAATDPKRRRAFRLEPYEGERRVRILWCLAFAPGAALAGLGTAADFVVWCGAGTTLGWVLVATPPALQQRWLQAAKRLVSLTAIRRAGAWVRTRARSGSLTDRLRGAFRSPSPPASDHASNAMESDRISALEARIAAIEAALAETRPPPSKKAQVPAEPDTSKGNGETPPSTTAARPRPKDTATAEAITAKITER